MAGSDKNRLEYERRVNRVLDHIRAHRGEELTLEALAGVAGFSPFHFHRIFKSMTGENLMEHIQRTRLEVAASTLVTRPQVDILEIALDNGFGSASAFARAFKERFGMSASQWRQGGAPHLRNPGQPNRNLGTAQGKPSKATSDADQHDASSSGSPPEEKTQEEIMNVKVQNLPTRRVAYMRNIGPYGEGGGVRDLWMRLARWATARDLWTPDRICLGVSHDDPKVTEPARCRYDAAIVVPADFNLGSETSAVNLVEVEGGKYAMSRFEGTATQIGRHYDQFFGQWLPQSGFQPDNRLIFELYTGEFFDECTGNVICDVCLPVRPL